MPDITMCGGSNTEIGRDCPKRDQCYRHVAKPCEYRQSYFMQAPLKIAADGETTCDYFWDKDSR